MSCPGKRMSGYSTLPSVCDPCVAVDPAAPDVVVEVAPEDDRGDHHAIEDGVLCETTLKVMEDEV